MFAACRERPFPSPGETCQGLLSQQLPSAVGENQPEPHRGIKAEGSLPTGCLLSGKRMAFHFIFKIQNLYMQNKGQHGAVIPFPNSCGRISEEFRICCRMLSSLPPKVVSANILTQ